MLENWNCYVLVNSTDLGCLILQHVTDYRPGGDLSTVGPRQPSSRVKSAGPFRARGPANMAMRFASSAPRSLDFVAANKADQSRTTIFAAKLICLLVA